MGYRELADAIVVQAALDYRAALLRLKDNPESRNAMKAARDCETFFHSEWFQTLSRLDGGYLMEIIREEVKNA